VSFARGIAVVEFCKRLTIQGSDLISFLIH
jgi:hypothetical protein